MDSRATDVAVPRGLRGATADRTTMARTLAYLLFAGAVLACLSIAVPLSVDVPDVGIAGREQAHLRSQLKQLDRQSAADQRATASIRDLPRRLSALAARAESRARPGHALGRIRLPSLGCSYVLV